MISIEAGATTGSCSATAWLDAPDTHSGVSCGGVCAQSGSAWVCDLENLCTTASGRATIVQGFGISAHDYSAWGQCGATEFCCVFDEDSTPITTIELYGTDYADDPLSFVYLLGDPNEENLESADTDSLIGAIHGRGGGDELQGSNYAGGLYLDRLYGEDGADFIFGNADGDRLEGGGGDDTLNGGPGADLLRGGVGDDILNGGLNNDTICDTSGQFGDCDVNIVEGGLGNDTLWYEQFGACTTPMDLANSSMGTGSETCGDNSVTAWPAGDLPNDCDFYITTAPAACN